MNRSSGHQDGASWLLAIKVVETSCPKHTMVTWCIGKLFSWIFFCVGVVYSGEYDICGVTLNSCISTPGEPAVAGHVFRARPVWIYTQSNTTNIIFMDVVKNTWHPKSNAILYIQCMHS
jgi:hypothetical protein